MLTNIAPAEAARLLAAGATLVDVREPDEYARGRIEGARNLPLSRLGAVDLAPAPGQPVVFHCRSGARTAAHVARLEAKAGGAEAFILAGGLDAWQRAGLAVARDHRQPIEIMRQVQITAGSLVLLGVVLGALASPLFYWLAGFIGAGLVFSGVSGTCGMAAALKLMPWNRRAG